ncbi:unnamed protein product [Rotaria socialis]
MNRINEEEDRHAIAKVFVTVDQFSSGQLAPECTRNNIYSSKQYSNKNDRSQYQTITRPTSLPPARQTSSLNENSDEDVKQRRRYASDSNTIDDDTNELTLLVTSFLQYLRNQLKSSTDGEANVYYQYRQQKSSKIATLSSIKTSQAIIMSSQLSNEHVLDTNDHIEILTLINLLVLRVECLSKEKKSKKRKKRKDDNHHHHPPHHPTVAEVDQNLIEYLYYLFKKFINDETNPSKDLTPPIIDKSNFVSVCQTLVRNGCFDVPSTTLSTSLTQSYSESASISDQTLTSMSEYHHDANEFYEEDSLTDDQFPSIASPTKETFFIGDIGPAQTDEILATYEARSLLPLLAVDEPLLTTNDIYKSCESGSTHSIYLSPNSSSIDLPNMVQEFDELNQHSNVSLNEDGSSSNVTVESKTMISNDDIQSSSNTSDTIYTRLTNDDTSSVETSEQMVTNTTDKMSRREKKMQERWSTSTKTDKNNDEQLPPKNLLGVHFPPIAVLRKKFSSSTITKQEKNKMEIDPNSTTKEINTLAMTATTKQTNIDQVVEPLSKDLSSLISKNADKNNDDGQLPEFICLSEEEIVMGKKQGSLLSYVDYQTAATIENIHNHLADDQHTNSNQYNSTIIINPVESTAFSSSPSISILPSSLTLTANESKTNEYLLKEKEEEEEEEKEEQQHGGDDYNVEEEKKNNSSFVHDYHASGIISRNDELRQMVLLQQENEEKEEKEEEEKEERERPSSPLPTLEQFNKQRIEDESPIQSLSNNLNKMATANIGQHEEQYKKVEIEEIPDDEEAILKENIDSIEPTDFILTDDEPKQRRQPSPQSTITTILSTDEPIQLDNVLSCYKKAISKIVDTPDDSLDLSNKLSSSTAAAAATAQLSADDPIALRAIKRFEERMNAAVPKPKKEDTSLAAKGKSSWSGSLSSTRKSLENLFKNAEQQLHPDSIQVDTESTQVPSSVPSDSYIRPRKVFDDSNFNYGTTLDLLDTTRSTIHKTTNDDKTTNQDDQKVEEEEEQQQQSSSAIVANDDKRVADNNDIVNFKDQRESGDEQQQQSVDDTIMTSEGDLGRTNESLTSIIAPTSTDSSILIAPSTTVVAQTLPTEENVIRPYGFQLETRRRLNTIERIRERRQSREHVDQEQQQQQQQQKLENEYTIKPEEVVDPIVRRALERFDERSRKLTQTKSMNYDDIQDPITRRALMRLESNLKRTIPPTTNDPNENCYTENYTLGSLQPAPTDRLSRYASSSQSPISNNRTKYISVHQRYCTPSSNEMSDLSATNNLISSNEFDIPTMRVPAQPVYVTSNNQQQPTGFRQRSRSEDMLSSRDLQICQTTNLDDIDTSSQLQRNHSSKEIALNENKLRLPNTLIKALEPNFTRTNESSVSYATPTQTYAAYSCEYTRPRRNPLVTVPSEPAKALKNEPNQIASLQQEQCEIQRPVAYRPSIETQSSSAFAPVHSSIPSTTNSYYGQQPLPTPSYNSTYTPSNLNQTTYSDDPIVRRALERFNSQIQNSLKSTAQYQPTNSYLTRSGTFQDNYFNSNQPALMTTSTSSNGSAGGGYQSIIGRRRLTRYDEPNQLLDNPSVGDAYSSPIFANPQNTYLTNNHYMNMGDQPPVVPPRLRRPAYQNEDINDNYRRHSIDEYLAENVNNNNNNNNNSSQTLPRDPFIHYAYPATITNATSFRPINTDYNQQCDPSNQLLQEQNDLRHRTQSTSSTNSSESFKQQQQQRVARPNNIRTQINNQSRLPPSSASTRTNIQQNDRRTNERIPSNKFSPVNPQSPQGLTSPSNGNVPNDSVFHRLAYTGTKASLSKTSSNSCSNLINKNLPQTPTTQLKTCEIDFDDSMSSSTATDNNENNHEQISGLENKYPRSKSVDGRARLKIIQARANNLHHTSIDNDENSNSMHDESGKQIPSSRFSQVNGRRDVPSASRVPVTPPTIHRTTSGKRPPSRNNLPYQKATNGFRTQGSNGNLMDSYNQQQDIENDANMSYSTDNYQIKPVTDNRMRTTIPVQHYGTNNIQTSSSTSAVNNHTSRSKPPVSIPISFDRRDSNSSSTDLNRSARRLDDSRFVSPTGQRRNIPVSVFAPAKIDNKRPAPAPPTPSSESHNQIPYSPRSLATDNGSSTKLNENFMNKKSPSSDSGARTPTGMTTNEFSLVTDKLDTSKKMNVFERLFRGNKKKN